MEQEEGKQLNQVGEYVTVQEAARRLGLTKWAIYKRVFRRKLAVSKVGNSSVILITDLEK